MIESYEDWFRYAQRFQDYQLGRTDLDANIHIPRTPFVEPNRNFLSPEDRKALVTGYQNLQAEITTHEILQRGIRNANQDPNSEPLTDLFITDQYRPFDQDLANEAMTRIREFSDENVYTGTRDRVLESLPFRRHDDYVSFQVSNGDNSLLSTNNMLIRNLFVFASTCLLP